MFPAAIASADLAVGVAVWWIILAAVSLLESEHVRFINRIVFPAGAAAAFVLAAVGLHAVGEAPQTLTLPLGLPDLPFHLRLDALSAFFLLLLGVGAFGVCVYASGYFRGESPQRLRLLSLQYHIFLASMAFVLLADDAYLFMVAWESMAVSSYFLVTTDHRQAAIRSAGFLYLLIAHVGAIAILLCFGILHGGGAMADYSFDALRANGLESSIWGSVAFALAFVGFGAKAGMIPLHAWLPEAHPAAPSPVSALLSGVMLKTAIYGLVRVVFDLIGFVRWEWGLAVAIVGALTSLFGVLYALMQHDLKRLLAYHSVENIGIILIGIGLAMVFVGTGHYAAGALGLIAGLYHTLNHAVFKSLLFLGAGSILRATGLRDLNDMGGLIHRMPAAALYFLVGALSISALPPLNGFVSEWLTFQTALQASVLSNGVLRSLVPLVAATLALAGALTAMCFVKVYGVAFLGQRREPRHAESSHDGGDASGFERVGMAWLAVWCVVLGVFPTWMIAVLDQVSVSLMGHGLPPSALDSGWLWLAPTSAERASYSPLIFLLVISIVFGLTYFAVRWIWHGRMRRTPAWDCGYPEQSARMQDTADAFSQPIRWIFAPIYRIEQHVPAPDDPRPRFALKIEDKFWRGLYLPIARAAEFVSDRVGMLQMGRISVYLLYSFVTLIALLVFVR